MLKFTVSGTYRNAHNHDAERVEFEKLEIIMHECEEGRYTQNLFRLVPIALKGSEKYPVRCEVLEQVFIDKVENVDTSDPLVGKDVKELSWEELQMLCVKHNLREIPLPGFMALREAREIAYKAYMENIRLRDLPNGSFADWPPLIIDISKVQVKEAENLSNDKLLEIEQKNPGASDLTMEELKEAAKMRGISFGPNIGYQTLYAKVFP